MDYHKSKIESIKKDILKLKEKISDVKDDKKQALEHLKYKKTQIIDRTNRDIDNLKSKIESKRNDIEHLRDIIRRSKK